ncbi:hypothetical protein [Streptomyces albidoflavus]|uniref:hypothetical protein n=1 Tax=Streptomyces albidoflavus TaxID=1886 RepID=UPI00101E717C|nr:hypothetical protein [Streptomyces albidoflavus]RZD82224.1 hypothetical protein C0Q63_22555 [Streptomyces albidoflavus]
MRTCYRFGKLREEYEREIGFILARQHGDGAVARFSVKQAAGMRQSMARALNRHVGRCRECG